MRASVWSFALSQNASARDEPRREAEDLRPFRLRKLCRDGDLYGAGPVSGEK